MDAPTVTAVAAVTTDLIGSIPGDAGGRPTPCADWDVDALTAHLRQVIAALELAGRTGAVPPDHWGKPSEVTALGADWRMPAGPVDMSGMTMPAEQATAMLVADLVLHGWDLASALDRRVTWDDAAVEATYGFLTVMVAQGRAMQLFGAEVPVPADAPLLDRALGLSGRNPAQGAPIS